MARFNISAAVASQPDVINQAGGSAYSVDPRYELASLLLTSFVADKFYQNQKSEDARLQTLIHAVDPLFAAKAAIFARNEYGMRSVSHVTAARLAARISGQEWAKDFYRAIARRPDDILETLSFYFANCVTKARKKCRPIPNAMKKGFGKALAKYDAYQLAKYRGGTRQLKLVDAVNLLHPKAAKAAMGQLVKDDLRNEKTWEARISKAASQGTEEERLEQKGQAWATLIENGEIGYMALLKNLRNIATEAPQLWPAVEALLLNEEKIRKSLVLPFRFATAYEELQKAPGDLARRVLPSLGKACDVALQNCPELPGKTLIAIDKSGSMVGTPIDQATLFGAVLYKRNDADLMLFDSDVKMPSVDPSLHTLAVRDAIKRECGNPMGTSFELIFNRAFKRYDNIVILSDMQAWAHGTSRGVQEALSTYRRREKADPTIFSFDLTGYGTMQFPANKVYAMCGLSDKVFEVMKMLQEDRTALIKKIEAVQF